MTTVASLRVPRSAFPTLRNLAGLADDEAAELLSALESMSPIVSTGSLTVRLEAELPHLDQEQSDELVTVIFNLWAISASHDWNLRDVAVSAANYPNIDVPAENRQALADRIYAALTVQLVAETANAADVATEYDSIFHIARCFTDLRPVFPRDSAADVSGAVVVHNLKIDYYDSGDLTSLTLTLTDDDLDVLRDTLTTAKERSSKIDELLKASGIRRFTFSEQPGDEDGDSSS